MARPALRPICLALLALAAGSLGVLGCGDDPSGKATPTATPETEAPRMASGSPDGARVDAVRSPQEVLDTLRARVADGRGPSDASFQQDVERVAAVLWAAEPTPAELEAARVHVQVATIAGEVARWLAESPAARDERTRTHPTDVALHDAFLVAAARGPDAYRAWCATEGAGLMRAHREAQYERLVPPPR